MRNDAGESLSEIDAATIERARRDRGAFDAIYRFYARRVYAFCRAHSATREAAEDLTAQTFERALAAIDRYEDRGGRFSSWLLRIAANAAIDGARRGAREASLPDLSVGIDARARGDIRAWVDDWERAVWMREHLAALPEDQRRVVCLRFYEDHSVHEVAARMGRSEGAIKQLAQRALKALRERMREET